MGRQSVSQPVGWKTVLNDTESLGRRPLKKCPATKVLFYNLNWLGQEYFNLSQKLNIVESTVMPRGGTLNVISYLMLANQKYLGNLRNSL
jgi:hypothetical protein